MLSIITIHVYLEGTPCNAPITGKPMSFVIDERQCSKKFMIMTKVPCLLTNQQNIILRGELDRYVHSSRKPSLPLPAKSSSTRPLSWYTYLHCTYHPVLELSVCKPGSFIRPLAPWGKNCTSLISQSLCPAAFELREVLAQ